MELMRSVLSRSLPWLVLISGPVSIRRVGEPGFVTIIWQAHDPNEDRLNYQLLLQNYDRELICDC